MNKGTGLCTPAITAHTPVATRSHLGASKLARCTRYHFKGRRAGSQVDIGGDQCWPKRLPWRASVWDARMPARPACLQGRHCVHNISAPSLQCALHAHASRPFLGRGTVWSSPSQGVQLTQRHTLDIHSTILRMPYSFN